MKKTILLTFYFLLSSMVLSSNFTKVDEVIETAITDSIFPGASLIIGSSDSIFYQKAYGDFTYDSNSPEVTTETIYDLASVTKAFGTNFVIMKLVDEGKVKLDDPVAKYLPRFSAHHKEKVLIKDLLIHESGLPAYYSPKSDEPRDTIVSRIMDLPLRYKTNEKMVYSCLNFVTLMLVAESVTGEPLYQYYKENFTEPLGMKKTTFVPSENLRSSCSPTSPNLQGKVHDPLARGLEGLSGNAGLFSTTGDLAKLAQLLLSKGEYNGKRFFSEELIEKFTKRFSSKTSRALGFDTKALEGYSSAGKYFSDKSFGHTGFTGTSIWIDPVNNLFVVFLTNRVYPDEESVISKTRPKLHDAIFQALKVSEVE